MIRQTISHTNTSHSSGAMRFVGYRLKRSGKKRMHILIDMAEVACEAKEQLQARHEIVRGEARVRSHHELEARGLETLAEHRTILRETVGEREEIEQECVHMAIEHSKRGMRPRLHWYR